MLLPDDELTWLGNKYVKDAAGYFLTDEQDEDEIRRGRPDARDAGIAKGARSQWDFESGEDVRLTCQCGIT